MIEDKKDGIKIAENPTELLLTNTIRATENRIRESELSLELDKLILDYLKKKKK